MNPMLINAWFVSIIMLLVLANSIPVAFNVAVFVFLSPFVTFVCSVLFSIIPNEIWYGFGLMCLFLWTRFAVLPYAVLPYAVLPYAVLPYAAPP